MKDLFRVKSISSIASSSSEPNNDVTRAEMRLVTGYLSVFDVPDSDGEIIRKGAFLKSIESKKKEGGYNIPFLYNHDFSKPVGKFLSLDEDDYGLKFQAQMSRNELGDDCYKDYQDGILDQHSIGFFYNPTSTRLITVGGEQVTEISEVNLMEGSVLTLGANTLTRVLSVSKSGVENQSKFDILELVNDEFNTFVSVLTEKEVVDETMLVELKKIQTKYNELVHVKSQADLDKEVELEEARKLLEKQEELKNYYLSKLQR